MEQKINRTRLSGTLGLGGVLLRMALVLLCLTLLCVHLMGSLFAKYSTTASGSDSARVAKFAVSVTGSNAEALQVDVMQGNSGTYIITVQNHSEVAVQYDVIVSLSQAVPGVSYKLDDGVAVTDQTTTYTSVGQLAPNATDENKHTLTFLVDWNDFTEAHTGPTATAEFTFNITVHVEQVD